MGAPRVLWVCEMRVCVKRLYVVFLVSVQCGGVTEDFEADCTITDNINKIVRRLRLSSSKPFGEALESNLFPSESTDNTREIYAEKHVEKEANNHTVVNDNKILVVDKVFLKRKVLKDRKKRYESDDNDDHDENDDHDDNDDHNDNDDKCPVSYENMYKDEKKV